MGKVKKSSSPILGRIKRLKKRRSERLLRPEAAGIGDLSYAHSIQSSSARALVRVIELIRGQRRAIPAYLIWRRYLRRYGSDKMLAAAFRLISLDARVKGQIDDLVRDPSRPTVIVANHPFGLLDGLAVLRIAEELGRPFKIIINNDLMRIPEIRDLSLPVDFSETRDAVKRNLATKKEALSRIRAGEIIIIFPAGMVATAETPFGRAFESPWHNFAAKLIKEGQATVLPVYFHGQNSRLFHMVSYLSQTLRSAMLIGEFTRYRRPLTLNMTIGSAILYEDIAHMKNNTDLTRWLRNRVLSLADSSSELRELTNRGTRLSPKYQRRLRRTGVRSIRHIKKENA